MKKVMIVLASCVCFLSASAQIPMQNDETRYCAKLKDGIMVVVQNERVIPNEIMLRDSSRLTEDAVLVKKNGDKIVLNENECIDVDGNILVLRNEPKKAINKKKSRG